MKLPSYEVEFLPLERRLLDRRYPINGLRSPRHERRSLERRQATDTSGHG
jgi:hypothetical protein